MAVILLVSVGWTTPASQAYAANLDATADRVFGQPDFTSNTANDGGVSPQSLDSPFSMALEAWGNLYVADTSNNRVLEYDSPRAKVMLPIIDR